MLSKPLNRRVVERARTQNDRGQIWLNVASSFEVLPDYVNLDNGLFYRLEPLIPALRYAFKAERVQAMEQFRAAKRRAPVLLHDCRQRLPFPPESVDHILCSHFLEHVYPDEAARILEDFRRVLRPDGTLHVIVPNLDYIVRDYVAGNSGADALLQSTILSSPHRPTFMFRFLEFLGFEGLKHRWMYDQKSISERVSAAGFSLVDLSDVPSRSIRAEDGSQSIHVSAKKRALDS